MNDCKKLKKESKNYKKGSNNMSLSFLAKEMVDEPNKLSVFKDKDISAYLTDYAFINGASHYSYHLESPFLGYYFTKSKPIDSYMIYCVGPFSNLVHYSPLTDVVGARLTLPITCVPKEVLNTKIKDADNINYLYYGTYPQTAVHSAKASEIEWYLNNNWFGMSDNGDIIEHPGKPNKNFYPISHKIIIYDNQEYICMRAENIHIEKNAVKLSNGCIYTKEDNIWIKIEPVKWLIDEDSGLLISDKILFSCISFDLKPYDGNFENTYIYNYLINYVEKDMFRNTNINLSINSNEVPTNLEHPKEFPHINERLQEIKKRVMKLQERK